MGRDTNVNFKGGLGVIQEVYEAVGGLAGEAWLVSLQLRGAHVV